MSRFIVDVENFENHNIGTKAYNLFCMRKININTPALFCVDSSFLEIHLNEYGSKDA
jgi:phosphoenolpyruvate synthase/pyruvate phosphate dikinase